jgi:hypothetical protein
VKECCLMLLSSSVKTKTTFSLLISQSIELEAPSAIRHDKSFLSRLFIYIQVGFMVTVIVYRFRWLLSSHLILTTFHDPPSTQRMPKNCEVNSPHPLPLPTGGTQMCHGLISYIAMCIIWVAFSTWLHNNNTTRT